MNNKVFFLIILITGLLASSLYAQGDLLITPNRLVFKPNKVKEIINLVNTGSTKETYLVSFVERSMNEDGSFSIVTTPEPGQNLHNHILEFIHEQFH